MLTRRVLAAIAVLLLAGAHQGRAQTSASATPGAPGSSTAPTVVLRLANNTLLVGQIVREEGDSIVFDAGALGQVTLKKSEIVATMDPATVLAAFQGQSSTPPPPSGLGAFAAPGKVVWTRVFTFGGSATSAAYKQESLDPSFPGLTGKALRLPGNQYVAQGQGTVMRATDRGIFFVDASLTYAQYDPFGKQADVPKISFGYNFRLADSKRLYGVTRYTWYEDLVRKIDYSNQALFGVGVKAVDTPLLALDLVPGMMAIREKKNTRFDDQWMGGFGGLEQLTIHVHKYAQIEQRELFFQAFTDSSYRGLESYVGFKGMLSKWLGVQLGFSHIYDNVIGQQPTVIPANSLFVGQPAFSVLANNNTQVLFTAGVLVRF